MAQSLFHSPMSSTQKKKTNEANYANVCNTASSASPTGCLTCAAAGARQLVLFLAAGAKQTLFSGPPLPISSLLSIGALRKARTQRKYGAGERFHSA